MSRELGKARDGDVVCLEGAFQAGQSLTKADGLRIYRIGERRFRAAVSELRLRGYPVVSFSEEGSAYRRARTHDELETFIRAELESRATVLEKQIRELRRRAPEFYGQAEQTRLIA